MRRRSALVTALALVVLPALWGCAGGPARVDPEWPGYTWGGRSAEQKADPLQVQQQLASLTAQLAADLRARPVQRIAVLSFENTSGQNPESLGAYLTEKITTLLYADRVGTVVERTFLHKVLDEIQRGYSGPFDPLSLKEIGRLLNADTLILGSYTRLTNGMTEVMARAVSVETGEIVGAGSTTISGRIVPNMPIVVREPLEAKWQPLPSEGEPVLRQQETRIVEQAQELGPGTVNIVPSPAPGMVYSTTQFAPVVSSPTYPTPPVVIPPYRYAPRIVTPPFRVVPRTVVPFYSPTPRVMVPRHPSYSQPRPPRSWVEVPSSSKPSGHRERGR
jgi:TolB-like protein